MPNSIALAEKCLPLLDEVYKASAKTSNLDATRVDFVNANTVKVFKTSMDGLGDYSRNDGFLKGDEGQGPYFHGGQHGQRGNHRPCVRYAGG